MSDTIHQKINKQITIAIKNLGADIELLCLVGSYHETQSDSDILEMLEQYNEKGSYIQKFISPRFIFSPNSGFIGKVNGGINDKE